MRSYTSNDLKQAVTALGIGAGDIVCVHSALLRLGLVEGAAVEAIPAVVADALLEVVGTTGTLVVPAFNFGFCRGETFVRETSPAVGMGPLSEYIRAHPASRRSPHPMQSLAALGARAEEICDRDTRGAFDEGGAFAALVETDSKLLLLGTDIDAASIGHLAEQAAGVPYRYCKDFTGPYEERGVRSERTYSMFVRDMTLDPRLTFYPIADALRARGEIADYPLGGGQVSVTRAADMVAAATRLLTADPWCLVTNRPAEA